MNIYQKLVEVRKVVPYLQKSQQGQQYKYVGSSQVLSAVREKMDELQLLLIPSITDKTLHQSSIELFKEGSENPFKRTITYFTEIQMTMTWVNAENPEEKIEVPWYAQGVDIAGEKGVGKALTYGEKYFLLKQFNISTDEDDPDSFQGKVEQSKPKPKPEPATEKQIDNIKQTVIDLAEMRDVGTEEVYKSLKITDLGKLTKSQAELILKTLEKWFKQAQQK
ncbi:ERF family protein [Shouchella rhizosphaerae]|uniref:ERF family protein n=1 Tax=Shouchella rhizosphaerae TaxID=866786 RepID=UPI003F7DA702